MKKYEMFDGVYWDSEDLISCKQAACILWNRGVDFETLKTLNFGALDIEAVIRDEMKY